MLRGGYKRIKIEGEEFEPFAIGTKKLIAICRAVNLTKYIKRQQVKYAAHLVRAPNDTKNKQLLFNANKNKKKGREVPNLILSTSKELNVELDQFCRIARSRKEEDFFNLQFLNIK